MASRDKHFLLLPDSAFGHITPMLELARRITSTQATVTVAISKLLTDDMRHRKLISPDEEKQFHLCGIEDGVRHTLDEECSPKILMDKTALSAAGLNSLLHRIPITGKNLLHGEELDPTDNNGGSEGCASVDAVIVDLLLVGTIIDTCRSLDLPVFVFSPFAGMFCYHFLMIREDAPTVPDEMFQAELPPGQSVDSFQSVDWAINRALLHVEGLLVNSFRCLEPDLQTFIHRDVPEFSHLPLYFIGPLLPTDNKNHSECEVIHYLDKHQPRSVIYFSFGSIAAASTEQITAIAAALLSLNKPFIWSLRPSQQRYLPEEMLQPTSEHLIVSWAPQKAVLAHGAVRLFVSHCGWNSTLESLSNGVPIVAWSFFGDQFANAGLVVRSGCGVRVPGRAEDATTRVQVTSGQLKNSIDQVAQWEQPLEEIGFYSAARRLRMDAQSALQQDKELRTALRKELVEQS